MTNITNNPLLPSSSDYVSPSSKKNCRKRKEPTQTVNESGQLRFNEIVKSLPNKFSGLLGAVDLIVLYDNPYEDIVKIILEKKELPETYRRISNQITKVDLGCIQEIDESHSPKMSNKETSSSPTFERA